ncbi:hypothetical protein AK812_SmicGene10201 [Symbiodinium microadriaticum]|uniref:Uncharacterized protein n=1 Tax=Symbiodinium microadriaticum TaxID=2951 RepID=A0A1Q9EGD5_SYMMI|nr:hypothetical protein AK812_SmicGene10201 [Symbiodinium microadriaticum]
MPGQPSWSYRRLQVTRRNTMNTMMQKFMQDQKQADPIPNMQYMAAGGSNMGAAASGQHQVAPAGAQVVAAEVPAPATQLPAAATQAPATVAATNQAAVQLEMSGGEDEDAEEEEVLRQASLLANAVNKKKGINKKTDIVGKALPKAKAKAQAKGKAKAKAVLKEVAACPDVADSASRRGIKRARDSALDVETPHGQLVTNIMVPVQTKGKSPAGGEEIQIVPTELPMLNIMAFLWHLCNSMPGLAAFFQRQLAKYPSTAGSPWRMALYNDEISPGNQLKSSNTRKLQAWYLSFIEFDAEGRCQENLWFTLCLARSSLVSRIQGGLSGLTHLLISSESFLNLQSGCLLNMPSGDRVMFFSKLHTVVADESALKFLYDFKGSSGNLVCPLCANITSRTHGDLAAHDHSGELQDISCIDTNSFVRRTDSQIFKSQSILASREPVLSKKDFALLESSMGLNYNPYGVLAHRTEILHLFDKRSKPSDFKASASQCLTLYPLIRIFLLNHPLPVVDDGLRRCIRSFMKLCMVLDLLLAGNRGENMSADDLETAILAHCRCFLQAYGPEQTIPKFHYSLHLPGMAREKPLISCFTHERKHRQANQFADNQKNPGKWFEAALFKDVLGRVLMDLSEHSGFMQAHLKSPKSVTGGLLLWHLVQTFGNQVAAESATVAQIAPGETCEKGDMVLLKSGAVAEVWLFCRVQTGELLALLNVLEAQGKNLFRFKQDGAQFMPVAEIKRPCLFKSMSADSMLLVP